ncbi:MAG: ABC transporter substrate-binding protein [Chloroflexota bacterium]
MVQEPTTLDVTADATAAIATVLRDNVYEGLVRIDAKGKILPQLAKSWDVSPDGKTITFHLVQNATWQDGSPFTAQDVKFSWDRAMSKTTKPVNPHQQYWEPVQAVDAVDSHTVKVTLKEYSDNWLFHMGAGSAAILSSKTLATDATHPVGTGPFSFKDWKKGDSITLVRNDTYWGTKAKVKQVTFRFISDPNAMNNALKTGSIDAIAQVQGPEQLAQFKSDSRFTVITGAPTGKVIVAMNNTKAPLNNVLVRRALSMAVDRKAWIEGVYSGYAVPIGSHAVPDAAEPYYVDTTGINPYDPAKAKQLLAQAGVHNLSLTLSEVSSFPYAVRGGDILASELKQIGVTLKIDQMEFPAWLKNVFTGPQNFDMTIINHVEPRDISIYANPKYYFHYNNPQVATWLKQADAQPNAAKRNALYAQIQKKLAQDAVNIWVMSPNSLFVIKSNLKGFPQGNVGPSLFLGDVYFS